VWSFVAIRCSSIANKSSKCDNNNEQRSRIQEVPNHDCARLARAGRSGLLCGWVRGRVRSPDGPMSNPVLQGLAYHKVLIRRREYCIQNNGERKLFPSFPPIPPTEEALLCSSSNVGLPHQKLWINVKAGSSYHQLSCVIIQFLQLQFKSKWK